MRLVLLACLAAFFAMPARAETDFFGVLSGTFGQLYEAEGDCQTNPHRVTFTDGNSRALFEWAGPIIDYEEKSRVIGGYGVGGVNDLGIILNLDGESRLTAEGKPVTWVMRPVMGFDGYCWGRMDWPDARCETPQIRCPAVPLGS